MSQLENVVEHITVDSMKGSAILRAHDGYLRFDLVISHISYLIASESRIVLAIPKLGSNLHQPPSVVGHLRLSEG